MFSVYEFCVYCVFMHLILCVWLGQTLCLAKLSFLMPSLRTQKLILILGKCPNFAPSKIPPNLWRSGQFGALRVQTNALIKRFGGTFERSKFGHFPGIRISFCVLSWGRSTQTHLEFARGQTKGNCKQIQQRNPNSELIKQLVINVILVSFINSLSC